MSPIPLLAQSTAPSSTLAPTATDPAASFAAGVVFFVICGVIVVGALVLYLRNRKPRTTVEP